MLFRLLSGLKVQIIFLPQPLRYWEYKHVPPHVAIFNFLRELHSVLHNVYTNLDSHQQCTRVSFSALPHQHLSVIF